MNARSVKITLALCLLFLPPVADSLRAQDSNLENAASPAPSPGRRGPGYGAPTGPAVELPTFNIQIENGQLILAPLKDRQTPWTATHEYSVPATIDNLSKYLGVIDTNLNIVLSPGVGDIVISNLKLSTRNVRAVHQAIAVSSGGAILNNDVSGANFGGMNGNGMGATLTFVGANSQSNHRPSVEVFNLTGYIQSLGKVDDKVVAQKVDELKELILFTLTDLNSSTELPNFKFHSGTKLFIVIGKPEAIEVTRKIINALSGQQRNGEVDLMLDTPPPSDQK